MPMAGYLFREGHRGVAELQALTSGYDKQILSQLVREVVTYNWGYPYTFTCSASAFAPGQFIEELRWKPRSLLGGGMRRFARGEAVCCLYKLYELCQE